MRATVEELHGRFAPPAEVTVAPVIAGGVPALRITPDQPSDAVVLYLHGGGYVSGDAVLQEAQLLAKHGTECGVDTTIAVYPVPTHDFHIFWTFLPEAMKALDQIGAFIRSLTSANVHPAADQSRSS